MNEINIDLLKLYLNLGKTVLIVLAMFSVYNKFEIGTYFELISNIITIR